MNIAKSDFDQFSRIHAELTARAKKYFEARAKSFNTQLRHEIENLIPENDRNEPVREFDSCRHRAWTGKRRLAPHPHRTGLLHALCFLLLGELCRLHLQVRPLSPFPRGTSRQRTLRSQEGRLGNAVYAPKRGI